MPASLLSYSTIRGPIQRNGTGGASLSHHFASSRFQKLQENQLGSANHLHEPGWKNWVVHGGGEVKHCTSTFENLMMNLQTTTDMAKPGFNWIGPQAENFRAEIEQNTYCKVGTAFD